MIPKTIVHLSLALAFAAFVLPLWALAETGNGDTASVRNAQNALYQWKSHHESTLPPAGCERCSEIRDRLADTDEQCDKVAADLELLLKKFMAAGADRPGGSALQELKDGTAQLESCRVQRDAMLDQQKIEVEKFKKRKWRPDDSRQREEMRYYNPNRPR